MSLLRTLLIARKSLREILREPTLLLFTLLIPGFFMVVTYVGYGSSPKTATYAIWVIQNTPKAETLIQALKAERYADGRPAFALTLTQDRVAAETALKDQRAAALLIFQEDAAGQVGFTARGDALNMAFTKAGVQLESVLFPILEEAQGKPRLVTIRDQPLSMPRPVSDFEFFTPGMMVFALLLLIPQTAMLVGRELRWGTLRRLEISQLRSSELFGGICLAQMVIAVLQVVLMFLCALAFGFESRGSFLLALVIGLALAFGSVGMGLLMACFIRSDSDALNTGSAVSMLQVFLSGAFFAMPGPTVFTLLGHQISAFDFLPATHGMLALQQVLTGGAGLSQVAFRLGAVLILSFIYFFLGIGFFSIRLRIGIGK